jgi:hypothetical protein
VEGVGPDFRQLCIQPFIRAYEPAEARAHHLRQLAALLGVYDKVELLQLLALKIVAMGDEEDVIVWLGRRLGARNQQVSRSNDCDARFAGTRDGWSAVQ